MTKVKYVVAAFLCTCLWNVSFAKEIKTPTCKEAADFISGYGESGDCLYGYEKAKMLSVDKENGVITCQAIMNRECPNMPDENMKRAVKFNAQYGIVTEFLDEEY